MKKTIFFSIFQILMIHAFAQQVLVDIPINRIDSFGDVSTFNNNTTLFSITGIPYSTDEIGNDSSAIYFGTRKFLEIDGTQIISTNSDTLSFQIKVKLEPNPNDVQFPTQIPTSGKAFLFGQANNIGLLFDYSDSTIQDMEGLISYKVTDPTLSWLKLNLTYYPDSTLKLVLNDSVVATSNRNQNSLLDSTLIASGIYYSSAYLYGKVDSLRLILNPITTSLNSRKENETNMLESIIISPNPSQRIVNLKGINIKIKQIEIYNVQGVNIETITSVSNEIDLTSFDSGIYFFVISNDETSITRKVIKL